MPPTTQRLCPACGRMIRVKHNDRLYTHNATVAGELVYGQPCVGDDVQEPVLTISFPGRAGVVHLPVVEQRIATGVHPTVVITMCGMTGIAHVRYRRDATCKECRKAERLRE